VACYEEVSALFIMTRRWNLLQVWPVSLTVLLLVASNCGPANGKRFIGCLFQNGLCQVGKEWCYDDAIFGRCLSLQSDAYDLSTTLKRDSLDEIELATLENALTHIQRSGNRWTDGVTQCVLQSIMAYIQTKGKSKAPEVCVDWLTRSRNKNADKSARINNDPLLAPVYLSRKELSSLADLTDDLYQTDDNIKPLGQDMEDDDDEEDGDIDVFDDNYEKRQPVLVAAASASNPLSSHSDQELQALMQLHRLQKILSSFKNRPRPYSTDDFVERRPYYDNKSPSSSDVMRSLDDDEEEEERGDDVDDEDDFNAPLPGNLYAGDPKFERRERLDVKKPGPWYSVNNFAFESNARGVQDVDADADVAPDTDTAIWLQSDDVDQNPDDADYLLDVIQNSMDVDLLKNQDQQVAASRNNVQRLLQKMSQEQEQEQEKEEEEEEEEEQQLQDSDEALKMSSSDGNDQQVENEIQSVDWRLSSPVSKVDKIVKKEVENNPLALGKLQPSERALTAASSSNPVDREIVEASYTFINIKGNFESWEQGAQLVKTLSELLQVPRDTFADIGVQGNQVTFRVMPNEKGLNPSSVAAKTDELRHKIRQLSGIDVDVTGIGDQTRVSSVLFWGQENQQMLLTLALCLLVATILSAAVVVFLLRNRYIARQKLKDLTQSADSEAPRDYQDLCRARMAAKTSTSDSAKDPSSKMPHALFSRDSESSRSSTSSWCEEPVLTNMDISTGHMVLSYMEDHLRNKDRLDEEWQALCAYEAEPSTSVLVASSSENEGKNRCQDVLPYDHSRVVLNALANANGSDYINASTIADHDPRHPAYIAAQAPVPDSTADFWQMIWEQGSVVLVLLTRLSENGQQQCYNYWPEEGSKLYHIYEVHLVSEHIWCDDYLVRSFYLKNIRTGETRTVTQFHFQSWPENGVPASTKALLEFRRKVNKSYRGRSCPIVVHCSDGAGRTGTYCLIDMVLHRMAKGAREIDIAATLEHLRDQRPQAVRTKQQFEFVLTSVAEEVHAILRALPQ